MFEIQIIKNLTNKFFPIQNQINITHDLMFNINNICNLNCTNCSLNCGRRPAYSINLQDFKNQISKISKFINLGTISLIGGEPLLHPNLKEMCIYLKEYIPFETLNIVSYGILTNSFSDLDFEFFKKYNVTFTISIYPKKEYINIIKKFEYNCKKYNIICNIHGIRPCFGLYDYNQKGTNNKETSFYLCEKSEVPHTFVIYQNHLYNCCLMPSFKESNININDSNYLNINNINNANEIFEFANHPYEGCQYCKKNNEIGEQLHFWHEQNDVPSSDLFCSLKDLYLNHYDYYYLLQHTYGEIKECLQDDYFLSKHNPLDHLTSQPIEQFKKRFFTGEKDICIIFNKNNFQSLIMYKDYLLNQKNIEHFNLYFIADQENSTIEVESKIYDCFPPLAKNNLSIWFLKGINFNESLKTFINNSFISNKIYLSDFSKLTNLNYLSVGE